MPNWGSLLELERLVFYKFLLFCNLYKAFMLDCNSSLVHKLILFFDVTSDLQNLRIWHSVDCIDRVVFSFTVPAFICGYHIIPLLFLWLEHFYGHFLHSPVFIVSVSRTPDVLICGCMCICIEWSKTWFLNHIYVKWTGHLTARSDVYSFGVVLLELLTGRKSVDKTRPSKEQSLVDWARPKLNDKRKLLQIIDPRLENQYSVRAAQKACSLAYYCLSQNPKARPLMSDVVETLEPLQSTGDGASEISSSLQPTLTGGSSGFAMGGVPDYRMRHRFPNNVGPGAICRSPNPNCSPGGPTACRVRWEVSPVCTGLWCVSSENVPKTLKRKGVRFALFWLMFTVS